MTHSFPPRRASDRLGGNNTIACDAGGGDCVLMGETLLPDPSGRSMVTTGNTGSLNVRHSPVPFAEGGYGRGMVELAVDWSGASMDDDVMGFTVGYDRGDRKSTRLNSSN